MTMLRMLAPIGLLVLASACNGDDGNGGGSSSDGSVGVSVTDSSTSDGGGSTDLTDDQQAAADQLQQIGQEEGIVFNQECVEEKAARLSDADAAALAAAGPDGDPELTEDGEALTNELAECVDSDATIELLISTAQESGVEVDADCVRDAFDGIDIGDLLLAAEGDAPADSDAQEVFQTVAACFDNLGG